jgi:glycine cleavage system H lipoate-binding protein
MTALLVFFAFVLLLATDYIVRWLTRPAAASAGAQALGTAHGLRMSDLRLPKGLFFHPGHSWAALQPGGNVRVGIDDFLQKLAGTVDGIQAPETGTQIQQGDTLLSLKVGPRTLTVPAPLSGTVTAVNLDLLKQLPTLKMDALNAEWVVDLEPSHLADELGQLSVAARATDWLETELLRLNEFLSGQIRRPAAVGVTLPDGGEPVEGLLQELDDGGWQDFQQEFLS